VDKITHYLNEAGFRSFEYSQTLITASEHEKEEPKQGYGAGGFVVIKAQKSKCWACYHYLPPDKPARLSPPLLDQLQKYNSDDELLFFKGKSWTTDAPYRVTAASIQNMKEKGITSVEMEASALYAFAEHTGNDVLCFAHLTNIMAQNEVDFEKGEEFGSLETLQLIAKVLELLQIYNLVTFQTAS